MDKAVIKHLDNSGLSRSEAVTLLALYGRDKAMNTGEITGYLVPILGAATSIAKVKVALGSLRQRGWVEVLHGLRNEQGRVIGSGYCLTKAGEVAVQFAKSEVSRERKDQARTLKGKGSNRNLINAALILVLFAFVFFLALYALGAF